MNTARRLLAGVVIGLLLSAGVVRAQGGPFTAQLENFWRLISTGGRTFTTISITTSNITSQLNVGTGGTNTLPALQKIFISFSQDSILRMVLENRSATANADTELKLVNGAGTAFLGVNNVNNTSNGPNTAPAGAHRSWLDISDNTAGTGWDIGFAAPAGITRFYTGGYAAANFRVWVEPTVLSLKNGECLGAESGTAGNDTTLSRTGAAAWAVGNGTCGNTSGSLTAATVITAQLAMTNGLCLSTAPTISSGFGGTPSVPTKNGNCSFTVNVGSGGAATNGVVAFNFTAANGFSVHCDDLTTQSATVFVTRQIASTTTTATIANFNTAGAQAAWAANDVLSCSAQAN